MAPPKRPWFRFYVEAVHDRKLRRLKPEYRWLFVACLAAARQSPTPGRLLVTKDDAMTYDDLADFAGMPRRSVEVGMDALVAAGVLEHGDDGWHVPAWADRQYESDNSAERTRKWRRSDGDVTADVTPPETEAETEAEGGVKPRLQCHDLMPPGCAPHLRDEIEQVVAELRDVHGDAVDLAVQSLVDDRRRFTFPSKARTALTNLLGPTPAAPTSTVMDEAQRAQQLIAAEGLAKVREATSYTPSEDEKARVLEQLRARKPA